MAGEIVLGAIQLATNVVGGILGGVANYQQKQNEYEANIANANYNIGQLQLQKENLFDTYENNQAQLKADLSSTLRENNQGIYATTVAQKTNASTAAHSNTENQRQMYQELASLQREGMTSVGSAVSTAAQSGFRNTGSNRNLIREAQRASDTAYESARRNIQLSAYAGFQQAASDYFSANVQLEAYRQSNRNARESFSLKSSALTTEYRYNTERIEGEIGYWEGVRDSNEFAKNDFWTGLGNFFAGW